MSQIGQIVIKNGAAAPADVTFTPRATQSRNGKDTIPAEWLAFNGDTFIGSRRITLSVESVYNGISKVRVVIADPILATPSQGCCVDVSTKQVAYTDFFNGTFSVPSSSTKAQRADILAFAKNLLGHTVLKEAVEDLAAPF